jgi:hypothetical protein
MKRLIFDIPGYPNPVPVELAGDGPFKITVSDENGNIINSVEFDANCNVLSVEGSGAHVEAYRDWEKYKGHSLQFKLIKTLLYNKAIKGIRIDPNELNEKEQLHFTRISNLLNNKKVHGYVYYENNMGLSECDFKGRNFGRLLYVADDNPACIYFGYIFKRDDKSFDGHVPEYLSKKIIESVLGAKKALIEEIKREEKNAK